MVISPIYLSLQDIEEGKVSYKRTAELFLGVVPIKKEVMLVGFEPSDLKYYSVVFVILGSSLLVSIYCLRQTVTIIINPLHLLNARMNDVLRAENFNDVQFNEG